MKGTFVLRIEDTDRTRLVEGAVENLTETLRWAGLDFDEGPGVGGPYGPYIQSERTDLYRRYAEELIRTGKAYYAFDTPEELDAMRLEQQRMRIPPKYDRRALKLTPAEVEAKLAEGVPAVVRMKVPESTTVRFEDRIRGTVEFSSDRLDDQVLLKSDKFPTYHLANVVDDHLMGITHVIRGEEWVSSTPKHVLLYQFFGWELPEFAHLPLLLNPDKSKLSKRQGDVAVEDYRAKGILREALINFVALLGWNPGDERELFSLEELTREFSLDRVGKSGAVFNVEKLAWMNTQHTRRKPDEEILSLAAPSMLEAGLEEVAPGYALNVITLVKERMSVPSDLATAFKYFFTDPEQFSEQSRKKNWRPETSGNIEAVAEALRDVDPFDEGAIERVVRETAERLDVGAGKLIHPLRLCLSGESVGPGLFEMMKVLGKETCLRRINRGVRILSEESLASNG